MKIGFLGTGNLAVALGRAWSAAGHSIVVSGRSADRARAAALEIAGSATSTDPADLAGAADVIVIAVAWHGLESALALVGAATGSLAGKIVVDCTNPLDFATGRVLVESGSAAELVARIAPGAHVVKALHMFAGASWPFTGARSSSPVVAICGDDEGALGCVAGLVADLGARTAVLGGLDAARQAEEAAGFVTRLVATGLNPRLAVPDVPLL